MTLNLKTIAAAVLIAGIAAAAVLLSEPRRIWTLFGPADLGDIDFATLVRRSSPNDALACSPGLCGATADMAGATVPRAPADALLLSARRWLVNRGW